jgi:hypothetical protein
MIDSIGGIVIFVSNQAKAIEFYTQNWDLMLKVNIHTRIQNGLKLHLKILQLQLV